MLSKNIKSIYIMKKNKLKIISIFLLILIILCSLISSYSLQENIENQDQDKEIKTGFYNWTWESKDKCNSGTGNPNKKHKIGILFGGEKADEAIDNYKDDIDRLKNCDEKFLNLGGGLKTGSWNVDIIFGTQSMTRLSFLTGIIIVSSDII